MVVLRLFTGGADHQVATCKNVAQLSGWCGVAEELELLLQVFKLGRNGGEQAVRVVGREGAAGFRISCAHQDRTATKPRLRLAAHGLKLVVAAVEIERFVLRPDAIDDLQPLVRLVIAAVVVAERNAHHAELDRVPAGHHVETETSVANVIRRHHLLGGKDRIDESDVERAEGRDLLRRGEQTAGPGDRLEGRALGIARSLVAVPATDRQQELKPRLVGKLGGGDIIVPRRVPALGRLGQAQSTLAVHAEQTELELVPVVDAGFVPVLCHCRNSVRPKAHTLIWCRRVSMWKIALTAVISNIHRTPIDASSVTCPFCQSSKSVTAMTSEPGPTSSSGRETAWTDSRNTSNHALTSVGARSGSTMRRNTDAPDAPETDACPSRSGWICNAPA